MQRHALFILFALLSSLAFAQPWEQDDAVFNPSGVPSFTFSQPRFADLDADGDMDMLLGNTNRSPLYMVNSGTAASPAFVPGNDITADISSLDAEVGVCADMDADGDLDLVTGGYTGLHFFQNTGTAASPVFAELEGYFAGVSVGSNPVPALADMNADGAPDLVVGLSEDGGVRLYWNTGTASAGQFIQTSMQEIGDVGLYAYPTIRDLDDDGDQDILCGRDNYGFIYYQNTGTATAGDWQPNSTVFAGLGGSTYWNSPELVDLTGDGLYDLVFGTASGPLLYYVNTGTTAAPAWTQNTTLFGGVLDVGGASNPVFFDFDGDGDLDMISGSQLGYIKYFQNTGTAAAPAWEQDDSYFAGIDHSIYVAIAIGDVNGDGLPDAIVGDLNGGLYYHRNTGDGFVEETGYLTNVSLGGWSAPRLLDMDGDGDLDIAAGNEAGNLAYLQNSGNPHAPNWSVVTGYFGNIDVGSDCVPTFGDVDDDGDWDMVTGNLSGDLRCYIHDGASWTQDNTWVSGISTDQNATPALADLDADGDLDLTLGDYDGTFSYYRNLRPIEDTLNPPRNLTAQLEEAVTLAWEAPAEGSTSPFARYNVYLGDSLLGTTTDLVWTLADLTPGTAYTASVTAQYEAGESEPVTVTFTLNIYNAPQNLQAEVLAECLRLTWEAPQGSTDIPMR